MIGVANDGRVAQLGEHLLCKHAFISPKPLNRRLFTVQNPLLVGLPIGLQEVNVLCATLDKPSEKCFRVEQALYRKNSLGLSFSWRDSLQTPPVRASGPFHFMPRASLRFTAFVAKPWM